MPHSLYDTVRPARWLRVARAACLFALFAAAPGARAGDAYDVGPFFGEGQATPSDLSLDLSAAPSANSIPEPMALALLGAGLIGIGILRWLRR